MTMFPSLVNDLYPDCYDAADEMLLLENDIIGNNLTECEDARSSPCHPGLYSMCYPRQDVCSYKENELGLLSPCRNAGHLTECWFHECPKMFKCPEAYCVPHNMVCDGIVQCPHAEDEHNCTYSPERECPGLFRCKNTHICIHITQLCDGRIDCPVRGEDEKVCETCPTGCICWGLSYNCSHNHKKNIPTISNNVIALIMRNNSITILALESCGSLLVLDMQYNQVNHLTRNGLHTCTNLLKLNLYGNNIIKITNAAFHNLNNLIYLNISNNPLVILDVDSFKGLSALPSLHITSHYLRTLPKCSFRHLNKLIALHISNTLVEHLSYDNICTMPDLKIISIISNDIKYIHSNVFVGLATLTHVVTDQPFVCCVASELNIDCEIVNTIHTGCVQNRSLYRIRLFMCIAGITIIIINLLSLLFWICSAPNKKFMTFIAFLTLSDIFMGIRLILLFTMLHHHLHTYSYWSIDFWINSWFCGSSMYCAQMSYQVGTIILVVNSIDRLLLTAFAERKIDLSHPQMLLSFVIGLFLSFILTLANVMQGYFSSEFCSFIKTTGYVQIILFMYHLLLGVTFLVVNVRMIHFLSTRESPQTRSKASIQKTKIMLIRLSFGTASNTFNMALIMILQLTMLLYLEINPSKLAVTELIILTFNSLINPFNQTFTTRKFRQFVVRNIHDI